MAQQFSPGDYLVFQLESGFGLMRVLAVEQRGDETAWHLLVYEQFFPDIESAEAALAQSGGLHPRIAHMALTSRGFERSPTALLGNRTLTEDELQPYRAWIESAGEVFDRSVFQMIGIR